MITVLTGGTGGAKFVDGLRQVVPSEEITMVVNTGDDLLWWGLYVSPDIDSITYVLSGLLSRERGWGVKGDTFFCLQHMGQLGQPIWFHTGDRDMAVHILRSKLLAEGKTLSEVTAEICDKLGVKARIHTELVADFCCDLGQSFPLGQQLGTQNVHRHVTVAGVEPDGLTELSHVLQAEERVAFDAPASLAAEQVGKNVGD